MKPDLDDSSEDQLSISCNDNNNNQDVTAQQSETQETCDSKHMQPADVFLKLMDKLLNGELDSVPAQNQDNNDINIIWQL